MNPLGAQAKEQALEQQLEEYRAEVLHLNQSLDSLKRELRDAQRQVIIVWLTLPLLRVRSVARLAVSPESA